MTGDGTDRVEARFPAEQPLWVLAASDGTVLCARHAQAGLVVLSWTTRHELVAGVAEIADRAPHLFADHQPEQRTFVALLETAGRLHARLRVDGYVVEDASPWNAEQHRINEPR